MFAKLLWYLRSFWAILRNVLRRDKELPHIPIEVVINHILQFNPLPFAYVSKSLHQQSRISYAEKLLAIPYDQGIYCPPSKSERLDPYDTEFETLARREISTLDYARIFAVDILLNYDCNNVNITELLSSCPINCIGKRSLSDKFIAFIFRARKTRSYDIAVGIFRPLFVPEIPIADRIKHFNEYNELCAIPLVCRTSGRLIPDEILAAVDNPLISIFWEAVRGLRDPNDPTRSPVDILLAFLNKRFTNRYSYGLIEKEDLPFATLLLPFVKNPAKLQRSIDWVLDPQRMIRQLAQADEM